MEPPALPPPRRQAVDPRGGAQGGGSAAARRPVLSAPPALPAAAASAKRRSTTPTPRSSPPWSSPPSRSATPERPPSSQFSADARRPVQHEDAPRELPPLASFSTYTSSIPPPAEAVAAGAKPQRQPTPPRELPPLARLQRSAATATTAVRHQSRTGAVVVESSLSVAERQIASLAEQVQAATARGDYHRLGPLSTHIMELQTEAATLKAAAAKASEEAKRRSRTPPRLPPKTRADDLVVPGPAPLLDNMDMEEDNPDQALLLPGSHAQGSGGRSIGRELSWRAALCTLEPCDGCCSCYWTPPNICRALIIAAICYVIVHIVVVSLEV